MEAHFQTKLVDGMRRGASDRDLDPSKFFAWDQQAVDGICREARVHEHSFGAESGNHALAALRERDPHSGAVEGAVGGKSAGSGDLGGG